MSDAAVTTDVQAPLRDRARPDVAPSAGGLQARVAVTKRTRAPDGDSGRHRRRASESGIRGRKGLAMADFKLCKVLGSGGSATVVRADGVDGGAWTRGECAIKAVPKNKLGRRAQHYLAREIAIHRSVQGHANIVGLYDVFEDAAGVYLVMELLKGSDLYSVLKKERRGLEESVVLGIAVQVLDALKYMHAMGCAHRDIKLENISFVDKTNIGEGRVGPVKILDFGLACARNPNAPEKDRLSSEKCGTIRYAAPEIVSDAAYVPEQCDIWSVGIVLYSLIAHRNPYTGTEKEVLHQIDNVPLTFSGPEWRLVSEDTKQLIRTMLQRKGADRPSAAAALIEARRIRKYILEETESTVPAPSATSLSDSSLSSYSPRHGVRMPRARRVRSALLTRGAPPFGSDARVSDMGGFASHVTPDRGLSHHRRSSTATDGSDDEPASSHDEDPDEQPSNFFNGLIQNMVEAFTGSNSHPSVRGSAPARSSSPQPLPGSQCTSPGSSPPPVSAGASVDASSGIVIPAQGS